MPEFWNVLDHREQALVLVTAGAILLALAIRAVRQRPRPCYHRRLVAAWPCSLAPSSTSRRSSPCWPSSASGRCLSSA